MKTNVRASLFWFIGFLLFNASVSAQKLSSKKPYIVEKSYYQEIPFEYVRGKIIIPVTLQGEVYRFILDTGAPNIISDRLMEKMGIIPFDSVNVSDANETKQKMGLVQVPELSLADLHFFNTTALVHIVANDDIFNCFQIDGFIGSNILHYSVLQINHKERKLVVTDAIDQVKVDEKIKTKLHLFGSQNSPYAWITIEGKGKNQVLLDTGMEGSYDISFKAHNTFSKKDFYKPMAKGDGAAGMGLFGTGESNTHYRTVIKEIGLGGTVFKNTLAETTTDNNSRIGASFFEQGTATFDFKKKKFYFESYVNTPDISEKLLGFSPTLKNKKVVVGIVWNDTLRNQMNPGDEIISINGQLLSTITACSLLTETSIFKSSDTLILEIKNSKGEITEVISERE